MKDNTFEEYMKSSKEHLANMDKLISQLKQQRIDPKLLKRKKFSKKTKKAILERQNYRCKICAAVLDVYDFDHLDGNRENNDISNCQALCPTCHRRKSKKKLTIPKFSNIDYSQFMIK